MHFTLEHQDIQSKARTGIIETDHGVIQTPIFMPVGTLGSVKGVHQHELKNEIKAQIILGNTYHLYLRPGQEIIEKAGGLHNFNGWHGPILSDSGGYQVYSLSEKRKIDENGVKFKSHIDGSSHYFTPEYAIDVQRKIGADIIMAFDECTPYPCDYNYAKDSTERTHRWLQRCCSRFDENIKIHDYSQTLFPIVQGSIYEDLRKKSAAFISELCREGNAIGGLSVGEPPDIMYGITELVCDILPADKPRYLMGVGTPENILECIALGVDMFDCVMPTRNGRNGMLFTKEGVINIRNEKWKSVFEEVNPEGSAKTDHLYSKAYLRHLTISKEMLAAQIASIHNLSFYLWLIGEAREQISKDTFTDWKNKMVKKVTMRL